MKWVELLYLYFISLKYINTSTNIEYQVSGQKKKQLQRVNEKILLIALDENQVVFSKHDCKMHFIYSMYISFRQWRAEIALQQKWRLCFVLTPTSTAPYTLKDADTA